MIMFSKFWMFDGDRIPLTDLHVAMLSFPASILDFTSQVLRLSTLFYKTESLRTIGYFLQFPKLRELSIIWDCVMRRVRLSFLCGSLHIFGYCWVMMEDTGTPLFTIGLCCPNLSNSLWEVKPRTTCLVQESCLLQLSRCALVSSCPTGEIKQDFVLMTVTVVLSVAMASVFCTHLVGVFCYSTVWIHVGYLHVRYYL